MPDKARTDAHYVELGAVALTAPEPAPMCVGDVLYDHDWTPMEAARAVIEASGLLAENRRLREENERLRKALRRVVDAAYEVVHDPYGLARGGGAWR